MFRCGVAAKLASQRRLLAQRADIPIRSRPFWLRESRSPGVAVLDDMLLVSYIRQLRARGTGLEKAVEEAAMTRLRPVLMTTLVAALGFVPMALNTRMGAEVQRPFATVVIGGVLSAAVISPLVLRVLYMVFAGPVGQKRGKSNVSHDDGDDHGGWWCKEHGVPEEECSMCSSKAADEFKAKGDWCEGHNRVESQCFKCDPSRAEKYAKLYEAKFGHAPPKPTE